MPNCRHAVVHLLRRVAWLDPEEQAAAPVLRERHDEVRDDWPARDDALVGAGLHRFAAGGDPERERDLPPVKDHV